MSNNVIEYKCPNCGGSLSFDIATQKVHCPYCDGEFEADDVLKYNEASTKESVDINLESGEQYSEEELKLLNVYHCDMCGAEIVADENTAATSCPYCNSPVILKGRLSGDLKPERVIPFKYEKDQVKEALANFLKKKLFVESAFKKENQIDEVKGLYCPYWVFDVHAFGNMKFDGEKKRSWREGDYRYYETKYYSIVRQGNIAFDHIPVDGSKKMDDKLMESIEPFDYSESVSFNAAYLSGHLADRYDVEKEKCQERVHERVKNGTVAEFRRTIGDYDELSLNSGSVSLTKVNTHYTLYPVWILNSTYKKQKLTFAMNGQTGKLVGKLPCSVLKYALWYLGIFLAVFGVLFGLIMANTKGEGLTTGLIVGFGFGILAATIFCEINRRKLNNVKWQNSSVQYYRQNSMNITYSRDFYLRKTVKKERVSKN